MAETKTDEKVEREYVIPLRNKWKRVPRYKRANKAIKAIKEFLVKHMKIRDRDLKKIRIDKFLNEEVWFRGIKRPPARIKVKAVKEETKDKESIIRVYLSEMPDKLKFKKAREEKREKKAVDMAKSKTQEVKEEAEKVEEKTEEDKKEETEKKSSVVEEGKKLEKTAAKKVKHETKQSKQPKHQKRKALAK